jgi:DNA-directed RNA polymerase subunit RPC12/RpoP
MSDLERVQFSIEKTDTHGTFNGYTWTFPSGGEYLMSYQCKKCEFEVRGKSRYSKGDVLKCHVCGEEVNFDLTKKRTYIVKQ